MVEQSFDVVIVGAGPAGSSCAIKLADSGLKVALVDKASFPRDKTCGDALSVDVVNQLPLLSPNLFVEFEKMQDKIASYGVKIFSPNHNYVDIPFICKGVKSHGYISTRMSFDNLLFNEAKQKLNISVYEDCSVSGVEIKNDKALIQTSKGSFEAKMVVGADGAHSIISKCLGDIKVEKRHYSAGLRVYYENVASFHEENYIELHFFKDILPGYLWIFPLADNKANVGIGMLSFTVSKKKVNLKDTLTKLLKTHPHLAQRFRDARPLETIKGYGLPLGSKKRNLSGEKFLLTGDAAALIDPFSGEGIANAIRSGRVAADHLEKCFEQDNFSASFNKAYDKEIYHRMWNEFKISHTLQHAICYPRLFNFIVKKAPQSKYLHGLLIEALAEVEKKKKIFLKPVFYFKMLFK